MANNENYFDLLPNEIKIYILSYLNTSDLVNLSTISSLEHLTCEQSLIGKISFYKTAKCEMFSFLTNENRRELITSLNITGVYWVLPNELINGVRQLVNLKCLYAIDTQFEYNSTHLKVFKSLPQLNTLSITARRGKSATAKLPNQIIKFYVSSHIRQILQTILNSICKSSNVKELWLIEYSLNYPRDVHNFDLSQVSNLEWFVCWSYPCDYGDRDHTIDGMKPVFKGASTCLNVLAQLMFEKDMGEFSQEIYNSWTFDDITWKTYFGKTCLRPFGLKDAKTLMTGLISPSELQYTELNFKHLNTFCNDHDSIVHSLLMCKNMKMLKKLSISSCLCVRESPMRHPLANKNKRKRTRFSSLKFYDIVFNCPLIEELEIWECGDNEYEDVINGDCFRYISELKNLKKLSIQFPHSFSGSTSFTLFSNLPNLTSLRIHAYEPNSTLTLGVAKSLEYSPMLKYLRYGNEKIDLDVFFNFVCTLPNLKLEKLVLYCKNCCTKSFLNENKCLDKFLSRNKQLRFLLIKVKCSKIKTSLKNIIKNYETDWHAYYVKTFDDNFNDLEFLGIDNLEMISNVPMISMLHPFSHFIID